HRRLGMTGGRRNVVALACAREPPAAYFHWLGGIAHVEAAIDLVIERMRRLEVGGAGGHVDVFAVAEPELVHAARIVAAAVYERDRLGILRHRDVKQLEARGLLPNLLALIGDR